MTPMDKTKLKNDRQIRALQMFNPVAAEKRIDSNYYAEGYATTYEPYVLFETEEGPIYEKFERGCFDNCDLSDVIYQLNHQGTVFARQSNGSLIVEPDATGLFTAVDLGRTSAARQHYEEISAGMITKMSWGFILGDHYYDAATRTIVHKTIKKVFDVSGVSIPANQNTGINARDFVHGVMDEIARSEVELENRRRKLRLKLKIQEETQK